jgi:hypothetical protein
MTTSNITSSIVRFARSLCFALVVLATCAALATLAAPASTSAQAPPAPKGDAEILVPPQGSAMELPLHVGTVCILSFPEKLGPHVVASSAADFEIRPWGDDSIAVRATNDKATPATVALVTAAGQIKIKINITLRVVPATEPALTLVRFKAATEAEAFDAQVKAGIAKGIAPLQQRLEQEQKNLDALIRQRSERQIAEQALRRSEIIKLNTHARNRDHVILHAWRALLLGDDGYLVFEIQNRSSSPYHLASVRVLADDRNVAGVAYLSTNSAARDRALIGVVAPGATVSGVVAIPLGRAVLRRPLVLEIAMPNGGSTVRVDRGIELR